MQRASLTGNEDSKLESASRGLKATDPILRKTPKADERKKSIMSSDSGNTVLTPKGKGRKSIVPTEGPPPSLMGILASRRFSKKMFQKFHKEEPTVTSSTGILVEKEPTYKMAPDKKFSPSEVEKIIQRVIYSTLNGMKYSPKLCCNIMKMLSDDIKKQVKALDYPRYKIVCTLALGEANEQSAAVTSRCTWDSKVDNYASYTFKSKHLWCTATVYGIYKE